ncbi:MAG: PilN domain-containing protein [Candidatus Hydrogenedentes bacterium]|nr:PilN domain-containing protein [Candidatus Hydrogenedentota bacterium]
MSLTTRLAERGRAAIQFLRRRNRAAGAPRTVLILERAGEHQWKAIEAEIAEGRATISRACMWPSTAPAGAPGESRGEGESFANADEVVLVVNSRSSVCRFLDLVNAPPDQIRRMVALRLETELPYPVADSTWVTERQDNGAPGKGNVLVLAAATADIASAEEELRAKGVRCRGVEFDAAGLVEIISAAASPDEPVAVAALDPGQALLAIAEGGALRYARRIALDPPAGETNGAWAARAANELDQSFYDYSLRAGGVMPARMALVGAAMHDPALAEALSARLRIPVEPGTCPGEVAVADNATAGQDLMAAFPACVGALVALRRREAGQRTAAPPLRRTRPRLGGVDLHGKRGLLIAANAVILLALLVGVFAVRAGQLRAANRVIDEARPLIRDMERLQEEVDVLQYESRRQRSILDVFMALADVFPKDIQVESVVIDSQGRVTISGRTKTVEATEEQAIAAMKESPVFVNPKFTGATKEKDNYKFGITCELRQGGGGGAS